MRAPLSRARIARDSADALSNDRIPAVASPLSSATTSSQCVPGTAVARNVFSRPLNVPSTRLPLFRAAKSVPLIVSVKGLSVSAGSLPAITVPLLSRSSPLLAGFCGYLWISRFAVAYVDVANGFELQVVAACVIGGISTMGGTGRVLGCLFGALFLGVINNALPVIGVSPFWQMAISGTVIVIAVLLNERGNKRKGRLILRDAALARQKLAVKP